MKIPELQKTMFELATEMERAGLVEEVVTEGLALTDVSFDSVCLFGVLRHLSQSLRVPPELLEHPWSLPLCSIIALPP